MRTFTASPHKLATATPKVGSSEYENTYEFP